jgi:hypothetical protein
VRAVYSAGSVHGCRRIHRRIASREMTEGITMRHTGATTKVEARAAESETETRSTRPVLRVGRVGVVESARVQEVFPFLVNLAESLGRLSEIEMSRDLRRPRA